MRSCITTPAAMAAAVVVVVVVASSMFVGSGDAARVMFRGENCNTNFNNPSNWEDGLPLRDAEDSPVQTVFFGPVRTDDPWEPIYSRVDQGRYEMYELVFGDDGVLEMDYNGTEFVFHEEESTAGRARFVSGQEYTQECDFSCHENFLTIDGDGIDSPPCSRDTIIFPEEYTYKLYIQGFAPIDEIRIAGERFTHNDQKVDFPQYHTSPDINVAELVFESDDGDFIREVCKDNGLFSYEDDECVCFSSCPTADQERQDNLRLREIAQRIAEEKLAELEEVISKPVNLRFLFNSILNSRFVDPAFRDLAFNEYLSIDAAENTDAVALVAEAVSFYVDDVTITGDIQLDGSTFTFVGEISGPRVVLNSIPDNTLAGFVSSFPSVSTLIQYYIWVTVSDAAFDSVAGTCLAEKNDLWALCAERNGRGCEVINQLIDYSDPAFIYNNINDILLQLETYLVSNDIAFTTTTTTTTTTVQSTSDFPGSTDEPNTERIDGVTNEPSTTDVPTTETTTTTTTTIAPFIPDVRAFVFGEGVDEAEATNFIADLANGPLATDVPVPYGNSVAFLYVFQAIECVGIEQLIADTSALNPVTEESFEVEFYFGGFLPQADIVHLLQSWNRDRLLSGICDLLDGLPPFLSVDCDNIELSLVEFEERQDTRNRRGLAVDLIKAVIPYTMLFDPLACPTGSQQSYCPLLPASTRYTEIQDYLEYLAATFDLSTPSECVSFENNLDAQCLEDTIYTYMFESLWPNDGARPRQSGSDMGDWAQWSTDKFYELIGNCGLDCAYDGVNFRHEDYRSETLATLESVVNAVLARIAVYIEASTTTTTTTVVQDTTDTNASSDASASVPLPAIAGGAGGLLIIIIVVIVIVLRRRKNDDNDDKPIEKFTPSKNRKSFVDREVVAFANPMYDDGNAMDDTTNAIYDTATIDGEEEGLYDEPAFNGGIGKQNPMYQSTEDLLADEEDGEEEDAGYLDVQPEDEEGDEEEEEEEQLSDTDDDE